MSADVRSEITIGNLALRDKLIKGHRDKFVTVSATGVTGVTIDLQLARIGELRLGSITLRNVPIAFADVPPFEVFGLTKEPALLPGKVSFLILSKEMVRYSQSEDKIAIPPLADYNPG